MPAIFCIRRFLPIFRVSRQSEHSSFPRIGSWQMFPDRFRVGSRSLSVCFLSVHSRNSSPGLQTGLLFSHISVKKYPRGFLFMKFPIFSFPALKKKFWISLTSAGMRICRISTDSFGLDTARHQKNTGVRSGSLNDR